MHDIIANSEPNSIVNSELNLAHNNKMKYPEFAKRFRSLWEESEEAPETQKELAKWLDYSQPTISDWVNGEKLPSMETAINICEKFDCCVEYLLTGKGQKRPGAQIANGQINESRGRWSLTTQDHAIKTKIINWSDFCRDPDSITKIKESESMIIEKDIRPSEDAYIIEIDNDLFKAFPVGTQLLIDPAVKPIKNSIAILSIGDKIPTLVRWNPGFGELQVEPLESGYPNSISLENKDYTLLGVATFEQQKGRKL